MAQEKKIKIAIASGKGGTGKTFLSSNLFRLLQKQGKRAVLVDCDAEVPDQSIFFNFSKVGERSVAMLCPEVSQDDCNFCGRCSEWCSYHAAVCIPSARYVRILPDLCHGCGACLHACAYGAVIPSEKEVGKVSAWASDLKKSPVFYEARLKEGIHSPVQVINEAISWAGQAKADYMIMDAPPGCACPFTATVRAADKVVLVTEPTPFGLSDLKHTVQVLRTLGKEFCVVLNRSDLGGESMKTYLSDEKIDLIAEIPYSEKVASMYSQGKLAVDEDPAFATLFENLLHKIS